MIIDLIALEGNSKSIETQIVADAIDLESGHARLLGPVNLKCEVALNGFQATVSGKIDANLEIDCARCLIPVNVSFPIDLEVEFVDKEHFGSEGEHEIDPSNLSADVLESEQLDLIAVVREQLVLNLPETTFCTDDCKGLCEFCGTNLNLKDCSCSSEELDPRWSALKNL